MNKNASLTPTLTFFTLFAVILCCCCLAIIGTSFVGLIGIGAQITPTPEFTSTPGPLSGGDVSQHPATPAGPAVLDPQANLATLQSIVVPEGDDADLARRLKGIDSIPPSLPSGPFNVGDQKQFWAINNDNNQPFQVTATVQYRTDHSYFWIENGTRFNQNELRNLAETFEDSIYPQTREFFGSENTPGIDEDPRIHILLTGGIGNSVAGYFSSGDAVHPLVYQYSNAHEMFVFNADVIRLRSPSTYGTLAHEFQHMIHWQQDVNEHSWMNEGFSVLAEFLLGYPVGFDRSFANNPDLQLTDWPDQNTIPHYGAGFMFLNYFLNRFGEEATRELVRNPLNGMESVEDVLRNINATDPLNGQPITATDFFVDWTVTNYLKDNRVADGRYTYTNYPSAPTVSESGSITRCPADLKDTVNQFGADYIEIRCRGQVTLSFSGNPEINLLPASASSGIMAFWSNKGDSSNMTLTREFDFTDTSGNIEMTYQTWFDIEKDYDYLYLLASADSGETWEFILTPSGTGENPTGSSFGWGYNGRSNGWTQETVDLSRYAGQKVLVRFEYVTDAAANGEGLLLDDVSIPAIGYFTDFELDDGGWQAQGFARIHNSLPQEFRLTLITFGGQTVVQPILVSGDATAEVTLDFDLYNRAVLVVSGVTPYTRADAAYKINIP